MAGDVRGQRVQQHPVALLGDSGRDRGHQPGGQALTAVSRIGADGADLGPPRRVHPLAGHGHQPTVAPECPDRCRVRWSAGGTGRVWCARPDRGSPARRPGPSRRASGSCCLTRSTSTSCTPMARPAVSASMPAAASPTADRRSVTPGPTSCGDVGPDTAGPWVGQRHERRDVRADSARPRPCARQNRRCGPVSAPRPRCPAPGRPGSDPPTVAGVRRSTRHDGCPTAGDARRPAPWRAGRPRWSRRVVPGRTRCGRRRAPAAAARPCRRTRRARPGVMCGTRMKPSLASAWTYSSIVAATVAAVPMKFCRPVTSMTTSRSESSLAAASSRHSPRGGERVACTSARWPGPWRWCSRRRPGRTSGSGPVRVVARTGRGSTAARRT